MKILVTEKPGINSYIESLINSYKVNNEVICDVSNFFYSNVCFDFIHIHWPERLYKWNNVFDEPFDDLYNRIKRRLEYYKRSNTKIVITVHNILPHDSKSDEDKAFFTLLYKNADIIVHHCNKSIDLVSEQFPFIKDMRNIICKHGDYLIDYNEQNKNEAREKIGIKKNMFVILNFGSQQEYKNNNFLNSCFNKISIENKFLLIAGKLRKSNNLIKNIQTQIKFKISECLNSKERKYIFKTVNRDMLSTLFNASDILLLTHKSGLNSGIINLAATYKLPLVFPNLGCFSEQAEDWIYETYQPENIQDAVKSIEKIVEKIKNIELDNSNWLSKNSWNEHTNKIIHFVKEVNGN